MNCVEAQQVLPEIIDGSHGSEFQAHLKSCPVCSELVSDLELIAARHGHWPKPMNLRLEFG